MLLGFNKKKTKKQMLFKGGGGVAIPSTPPLDPPLTWADALIIQAVADALKVTIQNNSKI